MERQRKKQKVGERAWQMCQFNGRNTSACKMWQIMLIHSNMRLTGWCYVHSSSDSQDKGHMTILIAVVKYIYIVASVSERSTPVHILVVLATRENTGCGQSFHSHRVCAMNRPNLLAASCTQAKIQLVFFPGKTLCFHMIDNSFTKLDYGDMSAFHVLPFMQGKVKTKFRWH